MIKLNHTFLITGGAGFLGLNLAASLTQRGHKVILADVVKPRLMKAFALEGVDFVTCDLTNTNDVEKLPKNVSVVYHFAALSSPAECDQNCEQAFRINVEGTYNLLKYYAKNPVDKIIFPSAAHLYSNPPLYLPLDEEHPIDLISHVYNVTKKICEDLIKAFYVNHKLKYNIFRLFNTYGPAQSTKFFVPSIIMQGILYKKIEVMSGVPRRDFVYVGDVVDAFMRAAESSYSGGPINLSTGCDTSTGEVAKIVSEILNADLIIYNKGYFGPALVRGSNRLAYETLGWRPKTNLKDGLTKTVEWYKEHIDLVR